MVPTVEDVFHADTFSTDDYLGEIQSMTILTAIQVRSAPAPPAVSSSAALLRDSPQLRSFAACSRHNKPPCTPRSQLTAAAH